MPSHCEPISCAALGDQRSGLGGVGQKEGTQVAPQQAPQHARQLGWGGACLRVLRSDIPTGFDDAHEVLLVVDDDHLDGGREDRRRLVPDDAHLRHGRQVVCGVLLLCEF